MVIENAPVEVAPALWTAYKTFPKAHGAGLLVIPLAFPPDCASAATQCAPACKHGALTTLHH